VRASPVAFRENQYVPPAPAINVTSGPRALHILSVIDRVPKDGCNRDTADAKKKGNRNRRRC
jgi:hypothetical protein